MAKKKVTKKKTSKKKITKKSPSVKKKTAKKKTAAKSQIAKKSQTPKIRRSSPLQKKKRRIVINLIGFLVLLILSIVLYSVSGNYVSEVLFLTLIVIFLIVCIALFLALISVLFARKRK